MKAKDIHRTIKKLSGTAADEKSIRDSAQLLVFSIQNAPLKKSEKESLLNQLRVTLRNRLPCSFSYPDADRAEINSLLEELCLAADFYLLESGKRINLFYENEEIFVNLNLRDFENCFFSVLSALLKCNGEISVYVKNSSVFCSLVFRTEKSADFDSENTKYVPFCIYENGVKHPCIRLGKYRGKEFSATVDEDFSMLLFDTLSPMQMWLCDI